MYLFNLKEMIYLLGCQENTDSFKEHIYLFTKSIIIRGLIEPYQFVQANISSFNETYSFREIISIQ